MSRKNKDEERTTLSSLLQSTTLPKQGDMPALPPQRIQEGPPPTIQQPTPVPAQPIVPPPPTKPERPKPPETRIRTGKKFVDRHVQETFYVDKRLLPYLYQLVESYPSKVAMTTAMILQACRERGIEIPEDWDKQPFPE